MTNKLNELKDKWQSKGLFQDFVAEWKLIDDCSLAQWCVAQGNITMSEGRRRFTAAVKTNPAWARACHYHIGFMVSSKIRLIWLRAAARNSCEAARMWSSDTTLSNEAADFLKTVFTNPITGCAEATEKYKDGRLTEPSRGHLVNIDSEIVQGIING